MQVAEELHLFGLLSAANSIAMLVAKHEFVLDDCAADHHN